MRPANPANNPKAFHEPKMFPVLSAKIPNENTLLSIKASLEVEPKIGSINKRKPWKIRTKADANIEPSKTVFACFGVRKITADMNNKTKLAKINQKLPTSNIEPNKADSRLTEKRADKKVIRTIRNPALIKRDLGKTILPSTNLAIAQKTIQAVSPTTKSKPFEVSTGKLEKGKQKIGNKIITKNNDKNESLSNIFVRML